MVGEPVSENNSGANMYKLSLAHRHPTGLGAKTSHDKHVRENGHAIAINCHQLPKLIGLLAAQTK
jgi:hypothetical protein